MTDLRDETPESIAWQEQRNAETVGVLSSLPELPPLLKSSLALGSAAKVWPVRRRGEQWFQLRMEEDGAEQPCVTVRSSVDGVPRVLVDPNEIAAKRGVPVDLAWAEPSPDGGTLAYAITQVGNEIAEVFLVDVATGEIRPDVVPWNVTFPVSWLPDSSGFWCSAREIVNGEFTMPVFHYRLGEVAPTTPLDVPDGLLFPRPKVSRDGRWIAIEAGNSEGRIDYVVDPGGRLRPLLLGVEGSFACRFRGDELIALTTRSAPRGRLVRIPVETPQDVTTWTEVVPESDDVLCSFDVVGERIVIGCMRDAASAIRVVDLDGAPLCEVTLPGIGAVCSIAVGVAHMSVPMFEAGETEISFVYSDFATSPATYLYDVPREELRVVDPPAVVLPDLVVTVVEAVSADGTTVPAHVVHRGDLDLSRPHPTLVTGYGGFGLSMLPSYLGNQAAWVEAGGIYVLSHLRGGGELGSDWWRDGSRANKQHTFDDLFAVAERLTELGITTPSQLAMYGNSNGGLLAGAALAQRPDLWAAVVPDVPLLDMLNLHRDPVLHTIGKGEYGDPLVPEEVPWLRAHSPLERLAPAEYPATLVIAGANDPRCPAWHSRVFVERLEQLQKGDAPIRLRVHADQGHGTGGAQAMARRTAEWLAFCALHTGLVV